MQFTTVRNKEKYYIAFSSLTNTVAAIKIEKKIDPCYLESKKLVHSNQEHEKNVSQLFGSGRNWYLAISSLKNTAQLFKERKKWIPAIWRQKNLVHNCQEQGKLL